MAHSDSLKEQKLLQFYNILTRFALKLCMIILLRIISFVNKVGLNFNLCVF